MFRTFILKADVEKLLEESEQLNREIQELVAEIKATMPVHLTAEVCAALLKEIDGFITKQENQLQGFERAYDLAIQTGNWVDVAARNLAITRRSLALLNSLKETIQKASS